MHRGLLLCGEPMGLFIASSTGPLDSVRDFSLSVAGAEFNVAVGAARLGHHVSYVSKVGDDPFGSMIRTSLSENSISSDLVFVSHDRSTGFMLKGRTMEGDPEIAYFRKNSAASALSVSDVVSIDFSAFSHLHVTGIFPAVSACALEAVRLMLSKARDAGLFISFDPNLRPQLWPSRSVMVETLNDLARHSDLVLPGCAEGEVLCGTRDSEKIADFYHDLGVKSVIVKEGAPGAFVSSPEAGVRERVPGFVIDTVVDTVGAGDGFACGVITSLMEGSDLATAAERGCAIGAIQCTFRGDNEGLPDKAALESFIASHGRAAL